MDFHRLHSALRHIIRRPACHLLLCPGFFARPLTGPHRKTGLPGRPSPRQFFSLLPFLVIALFFWLCAQPHFGPLFPLPKHVKLNLDDHSGPCSTLGLETSSVYIRLLPCAPNSRPDGPLYVCGRPPHQSNDNSRSGPGPCLCQPHLPDTTDCLGVDPCTLFLYLNWIGYAGAGIGRPARPKMDFTVPHRGRRFSTRNNTATLQVPGNLRSIGGNVPHSLRFDGQHLFHGKGRVPMAPASMVFPVCGPRVRYSPKRLLYRR